MPRRKFRKSRKRARPWYMRKYNALEVAGKAWSGVKYLKKLVNVERKKYDTEVVATSVNNSTGSVTALTTIAQGDNDGERGGLSIKPQSLLIRGTLLCSASASGTMVRIMVVRDNEQVADTDPSINNILDGNITVTALAPLNNLTVGRYTMLYDKLMVLDPQRPFKSFEIFKELSGHIRYNGTASSDIQKHGMYVCVISNEATNYPTLNFAARLSYTDN